MLQVFLVDDEYFERLALKNSIPWEELGMHVLGEANNGLTAYEMMIKDPPDIAIVDINMPKLNGIELISRLNEMHLSCQYIILTGYGEFKYAQKAIQLNVSDYILKPINYPTLIASLKDLGSKILQKEERESHFSELETENRKFLQERYYNDLVNCNFSLQNMEQYDRSLAQELCLDFSGYQIAILNPQNQAPLTDLYELQRKFSRFLAHLPFIVCLDNKRRFFFILEENSQDEMVPLVKRLMDYAKQEGCPCNAGLGNPCNSLEKIFLSYNEACIALQNCSVRKQDFVSYSELHTPFGLCLDSQKKNLLRVMISNKDLDGLTKFLKSCYQEFESQKLPWDTIILHTLEFMNLLTEALSSQMSASISILDTDGSILDTLNSKKSIEELLFWLIDLYTTSIQRIPSLDTYSDITNCVIDYIAKHYGDSELSISSIAKALYLNYSYLCHCFKRDKQMTINDYIRKIRIKKAIELMEGGMDNISFVAEKTGFTSASYFSKQFKKSTGLSPSEYLKTLDKSKGSEV